MMENTYLPWDKEAQLQTVTSMVDTLAMLVARINNSEIRLTAAEISEHGPSFTLIGPLQHTLSINITWVGVQEKT